MSRYPRDIVGYYGGRGHALAVTRGSGVTVRSGHAVFIVETPTGHFLFNGNDCARWPGDERAINDLPGDGFHEAPYRFYERPLSEREDPIQMAETKDPVGDCTAVAAAFYAIYTSLPGDQMTRLNELARIALGVPGVRSLCHAAYAIQHDGAGAGAGAQRGESEFDVLPPTRGMKRRRE